MLKYYYIKGNHTMKEILDFGLSAVHYLQSFKTPFLSTLALLFHHGGHAPFYGLALGVLVWIINRQLGLRIGIAFLCSVIINLALKLVLDEPRPFHLDPSVGMIHESGGGLPSGHAQGALMFWGLIGWRRGLDLLGNTRPIRTLLCHA